MKRYISYFAVLLAVLLGAACSKDDSAAGSDNRTGVMAMTVSTRQTADTGEYDPLQHQTVYIYNDEGGLLRKYTSKEALPERLELLAGTYRVAVEAGEEAPADFTKRLYKGDEMVEVILPINYYQDTAAAPDGKYNIVVSCSTSAYGDYMDACTTNVMYVDDFEWVY